METEEYGDMKFEASSLKLANLVNISSPVCLDEETERVQEISNSEKNILANERIVNALVKDIGFDTEVVENIFRQLVSRPGCSVVDAKILVDGCIAVYMEYDKTQKLCERIAELLKSQMVRSMVENGLELNVIRSVLHKQFKKSGSTFVNANLLAKACKNYKCDSSDNE